jgi:hypothetical protein
VDRVDLARIAGSFKYLSRNLEDFLTVGEVTMRKLIGGQREEARAASYDFAKFAQAFGPDLSEIRRALADLTDRSTHMVFARQRLDTYLSFEAVLDRPAMALDADQGLNRSPCRTPGGEEGEIAVGDITPDQQASCPKDLVVMVGLPHGALTIEETPELP